MRRLLRKLSLQLLLLSLSFWFSLTVAAPQIFAQTSGSPTSQPSLNLTLSPVTVILETKPGETVTTPIKLRNNGSVTENLHTSFGTFVSDSTGQHPRLLDPKSEDSFMKWVSIDEPNFSIAPNEWKTVNFTFSPPADAALSYYYTIIFSREKQVTVPGETVIQGAPALLVLTSVQSPNAKKELQLESFTAKHSLFEFLPQTFELKIKNTGNVHTAPSGNIFIDGQGKKDIAVLSLNPNTSAVLPQSSRTFEVKWDDGFPIWDEKSSLSWDFTKVNRLRFGKYTAHVLMVYDNGERDVPIESFVSFWIVPWRLIAAAIAIPVTPAIIVYLIMRWHFRRQRRKEMSNG